MEPNNLQIVAKRFWHMVRVAMFMLRKGISKSKLLSDLNIMLKRGKIAGKAIHNLMFHHGQERATSSAAATTTRRHIHEHEFSCSNTPAHSFFNISKRKNNHYNHHIFSVTQSPMAMEDEVMTSDAITKALEMLQSETASSALPGFGKSPLVSQLRITDSPFPLNHGGDDNHVDEAAENFIKKFYKDLRKQNLVSAY